MKIDFDTPLKDYRKKDGSFLTLDQEENGEKLSKTMTLADAAIEGLSAVFNDEQNELKSKEKLRRGLLVQQIAQRPQCEISIDEANLIRDRIGRMYGPLVVAASEEVLDPKVPNA